MAPRPSPSSPVVVSFQQPLTCLSISSSANLVCVGGVEVLALCNLTSSDSLLSSPIDIPTAHRRITDVAFNRVNPNLLACGTARGGVDIYDLSPSRVEPLPSCGRPHSSAVNRVTWNPSDVNTLVSASSDGTLHVLDVRAKDPVQITLAPKSREVRDVVFSPHELYALAACFSNGTVKLFDYRHPRQVLLDVLAHDGIAMSLAYHPTRRGVLASGGSSAREGAFNLKLLAPERDAKMLGLIRVPGGVTSLGWRPSHDAQLATASDVNMMLWDVENWPNVPLVAVDASQVTRFAWVDEARMLACGKDGQLQLRHVAAEPRPIERTRGLKLSFAPGGHLVCNSDGVPRGLAEKLLTGQPLPRNNRGKANLAEIRPATAPVLLSYRLGPDLATAMQANANAAKAYPKLRGFWLSLSALLMAPTPVARAAEEKARLSREVVDGVWWSTGQVRLLRGLQQLDPLDGFQVRPKRGAMRQAVHELDSGLMLTGMPDEFVPLELAVEPIVLSLAMLQNVISSAIEEMANAGELQTCVTACLLLLHSDIQPVSKMRLLCWVEAYVELLRRFSHFAEAKDVLMAFGEVTKDREAITASDEAAQCSLCHRAVSGLYVACGGCGHGGHVEHIRAWFSEQSLCAVLGCGHRCASAPEPQFPA